MVIASKEKGGVMLSKAYWRLIVSPEPIICAEKE
jgi:hypothetical protein